MPMTHRALGATRQELSNHAPLIAKACRRLQKNGILSRRKQTRGGIKHLRGVHARRTVRNALLHARRNARNHRDVQLPILDPLPAIANAVCGASSDCCRHDVPVGAVLQHGVCDGFVMSDGPAHPADDIMWLFVDHFKRSIPKKGLRSSQGRVCLRARIRARRRATVTTKMAPLTPSTTAIAATKTAAAAGGWAGRDRVGWRLGRWLWSLRQVLASRRSLSSEAVFEHVQVELSAVARVSKVVGQAAKAATRDAREQQR